MSSIGSSLNNYEVLPGVREVPLSAFGDYKPKPYSPSEVARTNKLARDIAENKEINPLIVVMDKDGPYVLEGGHRLDSFYQLPDVKSFPAKVVIDRDSIPAGQASAPLGQASAPANSAAASPAEVAAQPTAAPAAAEAPATVAKRITPGVKDANTLAAKFGDWGFSPSEAAGMNDAGWAKLAHDAGVKFPSAAVRDRAIRQLRSNLAGPEVPVTELIDKLKASFAENPKTEVPLPAEIAPQEPTPEAPAEVAGATEGIPKRPLPASPYNNDHYASNSKADLEYYVESRLRDNPNINQRSIKVTGSPKSGVYRVAWDYIRTPKEK